MGMVARKSTQTPAYLDDQQRWRAVTGRDPAADGCFYYAVRTTGVYCRPSCPARPALRENVSFHDSCDAAERAGFRPCKRCRPDQASLREQQGALIAAACQQIQTEHSLPSLQMLADAAGMSRFHFHRVFKQVTGLTPKAYAMAHRTRRIQEELASGTSVTDAIYAAGYNSNSRFYAKSSADLGMKPSELRAGGRNTRVRFAVGQTTLGSVLVAATERGICAVLLGDGTGSARSLPARRTGRRRCAIRTVGCASDRPDRITARWRAVAPGPAGNGVSTTRLAGAAAHSSRRDADLCPIGAQDRRTEISACRGTSLRRKSNRSRHSVSSSHSHRRVAVGISLGSRAQTRTVGSGTIALAWPAAIPRARTRPGLAVARYKERLQLSAPGSVRRTRTPLAGGSVLAAATRFTLGHHLHDAA